MKNSKKITDLAKKHHQIPEIKEKTRYIGILLSTIAWCLYAIFTFLIEKLNESFSIHISTKSFSKIFIEFSLIHFFMMIIFSACCLKAGGFTYFRARETKLICLRSAAAVFSFWFYSFARIWTSTIDNSLQYSTDALWVLVILWCLKQKISKVATSGIFLSSIGIVYVYFSDSKSLYDLLGGTFGVGAGITLAIITVITAYLVKQDPPIRIGLYQSALGFVSSLCIGLLLGLIHGFDFPSFSEVVLALVTSVILSLLLYMIWKSFYYTEPYILGALSYILPVFLILFGWILEEEPMNHATIIGTIIITLGGCMAVFDSYIHHRKHIRNSKKIPKHKER